MDEAFPDSSVAPSTAVPDGKLKSPNETPTPAASEQTGAYQDLGLPTYERYLEIQANYLANLADHRQSKALISAELYEHIKDTLRNPSYTKESTAQFRYWVRKMFQMVVVFGQEVVAHEGKPVAVKERIYDILCHCHAEVDHGGRDRTNSETRNYFSWIPKELVAQFVASCPTCSVRRFTQPPSLLDPCYEPRMKRKRTPANLTENPKAPKAPRKARAKKLKPEPFNPPMASVPLSDLPISQLPQTSDSLYAPGDLATPASNSPSFSPFDWMNAATFPFNGAISEGYEQHSFQFPHFSALDRERKPILLNRSRDPTSSFEGIAPQEFNVSRMNFFLDPNLIDGPTMVYHHTDDLTTSADFPRIESPHPVAFPECLEPNLPNGREIPFSCRPFNLSNQVPVKARSRGVKLSDILNHSSPDV
jgi:hypothetical protein